MRAVRLLAERGVDMLIHLGDIGTEGVLDTLVHPPAGRRDVANAIPVHLVFGNVDWDITELTRCATSLGLGVHHPMGRLIVDGGVLAFTHGDNHQLLDAAIRDGVKYLCHGHTHQAVDQRTGTTRIINPGALHRAAKYTVAILNTAVDDLAFYPLDEP